MAALFGGVIICHKVNCDFFSPPPPPPPPTLPYCDPVSPIRMMPLIVDQVKFVSPHFRAMLC